MLAQAAEQSGWQAVVGTGPVAVSGAIARVPLRLALVDTESCGSAAEQEELTRLCRRLATFGNLLLVVCGPSEDPAEEIRLRQLGLWLYLPGLRDPGSMAVVCQEALDVARRMDGTRRGQMA